MKNFKFTSTIILLLLAYGFVKASEYYPDSVLAEIYSDRHDMNGNRIHDIPKLDSILQKSLYENDSLNIYLSYLNLAFAHSKSDGKEMLDNILNASRYRPHKPEWIEGYLNLTEAIAYQNLRKLNKSIDKLWQAKKHFNSGNKIYMAIITQQRLAYISGITGNIKKSYELYSESYLQIDSLIQAQDKIGELLEIGLLNQINVIYLKENRLDKAKSTVFELLDKAKKL
ncbi:MAG: hypothetical protein RLO81_15010, partial [Fulvivirga sp.]|uniref:hypothetical protein n=1 Tax=Fulvivirga sp. TaxID=1931237 RepID=UPI0032EB0C97